MPRTGRRLSWSANIASVRIVENTHYPDAKPQEQIYAQQEAVARQQEAYEQQLAQQQAYVQQQLAQQQAIAQQQLAQQQADAQQQEAAKNAKLDSWINF